MSAGGAAGGRSTHVTVKIAGQEYRLACPTGEAERMASLAVDVEAQIADMEARHVGIGTRAAAVLTVLTLTGKLRSAEAHVRRLAERCAGLEREREARALADEAEDEAVLRGVTAASEVVERVTALLAGELRATRSSAGGGVPIPVTRNEAPAPCQEDRDEEDADAGLGPDGRPRRSDGALLFRPRRADA